MKQIIKFDNNSNIHRVFIQDSSSTIGAGLAGLTSASTGMIISTIANNEATATVYTVAASNVETITTLGTYAAPTASKCRFKEVDATNMPGVYELQFADARYSVASSNQLQVMISGATNAAPCLFEVQLDTNTPADVYARIGAPAGASIAADLVTIDDFLDTEIAAIKTKTDFLPSATAGSAGGVFIAGSNAATSITTALTANITGDLSGSVGSVTSGVTVTTNNDKTGYALSSAGIQAIWDALTSALVTVGSVGKLLVDNINATISSRMATYTQPTGFLAATFPATVASTTNITAATGVVLSGVTHTGAVIPTVTTVTNDVGITQTGADKVWSTTARTLTNIGIKKNTALANFEFMLVDSTDHVTPKTGVTVTATRSIDGAAFGACANAVTELSNGIYKISLAAADLNGDVVTLRFTGTAADDRLLTIITTV